VQAFDSVYVSEMRDEKQPKAAGPPVGRGRNGAAGQRQMVEIVEKVYCIDKIDMVDLVEQGTT
jgi:hypothetical protein